MIRMICIPAAFLILLLVTASAIADSSLPPPPNKRVTNVTQLNNEEQVFISPVDSAIVIANWRDFRLGYRQIGIGRSTNGGQTWVDSLIPDIMQHWGLLSWQSDPTLTVDRFGNFIMCVLDFIPGNNTNNSVIDFYRSTDAGLSWSGPFIVHPDGNWFEDKQFITVDRTGGPFDGTVYCSWTRFPNPDRIMLVRSLDGGQTWSDTMIVGPTQFSSACGGPSDAGQFSIPIVSANGDLHIFWMGIQIDSGAVCNSHYSIKHRFSSDRGQTFSVEQNILPVSGWTTASGGVNTYSQPVGDADLSTGPFRGNLYLAFTNTGPEDSLAHSDVDFVRSTDNGLTWSDRIMINDDSSTVAIDNFHPWLICNEDGVLACVFYDQRYDPSHFSFDLNAAYSFDGGLTFTTNHRISSVSSSPSFARQPGGASFTPSEPPSNPASVQNVLRPLAGLIGEYVGVSAFHDKINAVWTDTRNGNQEVYSATWHLPLLEPRLQSPVRNQYAPAQPTFRWSTTWKSDQDRYRIEFASTPDFQSSRSYVIDTNFVTPTFSFADGTWYWRVKAFRVPSMDSSAYSPVWSFQVDQTPPAAPTLILPPDESTILVATPQFIWSVSTLKVQSLGSLVTYDLSVSSDSTFPGTSVTHTYPNLLTNIYQPVDALTPGVRYFWKVRAHDAAGNSSESAISHVTRALPCCVGPRGNVDVTGIVDGADLAALVSYLTGGGFVLPCPEAANVNGLNIVDGADLAALVSYLTGGGFSLPACP